MQTQRLILVDDNPIFVRVLADALERRGYEVDRVLDHEDARRCIRRWAPAYAVLDLNLNGASGLGLIRPLKDANPSCRVVVLTAYASIATAVDAIKLGADQYLAKPVAVGELIAVLGGEEASGPADLPADPMSVRELQWEHIHQVLAEQGGNVSAAARMLQMHRRTLQRKLARHPPS
jgi:two-component system response regulator RegA